MSLHFKNKTMKKRFKARTQNDEVAKILVDNYPNRVSTHYIREATFIVDVPKIRCKLLDIYQIEVDSKIIGYHNNKFGRAVKITGYVLKENSLQKAIDLLKPCYIDVKPKGVLSKLFQKV
jgi:hypothetical protein